MSNLSELIPAGGGQNNFTFTASGNISNGNAVGINPNGTVSVASNFTSEFGSATVFESDYTYSIRNVYDPNSQKVIFVYQDVNNSEYPTSVVGTVSGSTISFGTPTVISSNNTDSWIGITYDENAQRVVATYRHDTSDTNLMVVAGEVSGTTVTWGTPVTAFSSTAGPSYPALTYDKNAQKVFLAASPYNTGSYGVVLSLSGSTITLGSADLFNINTQSLYISVAYNEDSQTNLIVFQDQGNSSYATGVVATISGTSVIFGTKTVFDSNAASRLGTVYHPVAKKIITSFARSGARVIAASLFNTGSQATVSFGTNVSMDVQSNNASAGMAITYDSDSEKIVVAYYVNSPGTPSYPSFFVKTATVSGLTITPEDERFLIPATGSGYGYVEPQALSYDSNAERIVVAYRDSATLYGTSAVFRVGNLNEKFIGLAGQAISDGATGTINTPGAINESQSGLTIGSDYYLQSNGSLSTTTSSVKVGKAITATTINMKNRS